MEEKKGFFKGLTEWFSNVNNLIATWTAILLGVVGAFYIAWEFSDRWQERAAVQEKRSADEREIDNEQTAMYFNKFASAHMDELMKKYDAKIDVLIQENIKKDSILLLILPKMTTEISRMRSDVEKVNQKFSILLSEQPVSEKLDIVKMFNQRDSIISNQERRDSLDLVMIREIRNINKELLRDREQQPKFGDRAK